MRSSNLPEVRQLDLNPSCVAPASKHKPGGTPSQESPSPPRLPGTGSQLRRLKSHRCPPGLAGSHHLQEAVGSMVKSPDLGLRRGPRIPALLLTRCVALGEPLNLPEPQASVCNTGIVRGPASRSCNEDHTS